MEADLSQASSNISLPNRRTATSTIEVLPRPVTPLPSPTVTCATVPDPTTPTTPSPSVIRRSTNEETYLTTTAISPLTQPLAAIDACYDLSRKAGGAAPESPKKRNVNWHTPIQIYATYELGEEPCSSRKVAEESAPESVGERLCSVKPDYQTRRNIGEDDGFESLNGKSSSGEDNNHSPLPNAVAVAAPPAPVQTNQLRLRLNTTNGVTASASPTEKKPQSRGNESSTSCAESDECDDADIMSSPASGCNQECTTSATDWLGVTTNSEDCSYTSDLDHSDGGLKHTAFSDEDPGELDITPTTILNPHSSLDRSMYYQPNLHLRSRYNIELIKLAAPFGISEMPKRRSFPCWRSRLA